MSERRPGHRAAQLDRIQRDTGPVDLNDPHRARKSYAHEMMREEFAEVGHLRDFDWRGFLDLSTKAFARRRAAARMDASPWS